MGISAVAMACSVKLCGYACGCDGIDVCILTGTESMEHCWNSSEREKLRCLEKNAAVPQ